MGITIPRATTRPFPNVPVDRLAPLIEAWLRRGHTTAQLEEATGLSGRRLYEITARRQKTVTFNLADQILVGLDAVWEWHTSLRDLYDPDHHTTPMKETIR